MTTFDTTGDTPDPDLADERVTILDELTNELAELDVRFETLPVPARPGYEVRYKASFAYEDLMLWRKRARDTSMPGDVHMIRYYAILLAATCDGILRHGQPLTSDGEPWRFNTDEFRDLVGAPKAADAVRKFYGRDGDVAKAALDVLAAAGYSDDDEYLGDDLDGGPTSG